MIDKTEKTINDIKTPGLKKPFPKDLLHSKIDSNFSSTYQDSRLVSNFWCNGFSQRFWKPYH